MELKSVIEIVNSYLTNVLKLKESYDCNLKNISNKCYFTDSEERKYLICYSIFKDINELYERWESYQDEDIVLYLQSQKYKDNDIRWDIYYILINLNQSKIPAEYWMKIENDKFSCKKVYVSTESKEKIIEQLKQKLPTVKDYYPDSKLSVIDEKTFFEHVCKELKVSKTIMDDYYKLKTQGDYQVIVELVKALEGRESNE